MMGECQFRLLTINKGYIYTNICTFLCRKQTNRASSLIFCTARLWGECF